MIEEAQQHKNEAIRLQNFELAASFRDRENQYTEQLERLKNEWKEKLKDNRETVDAPQIEEVVSMISGVPVQRMAQAEGVRLKGMKQALLSKVIGQDKTVERKQPKRFMLSFAKHRISPYEEHVETMMDSQGNRSEWYRKTSLKTQTLHRTILMTL